MGSPVYPVYLGRAHEDAAATGTVKLAVNLHAGRPGTWLSGSDGS